MNHKLKLPELLAPAGGLPQLRAAVQNGADAVYMGGPLFNARAKADNFTNDDMKEAIDYAHLRNVRVYVTMNTLIKDSELNKAFSYINFLYGAGADAVILQDLGLSRLVRKYFPDLPMHMSTQGTVYNTQAVDTVKELGFKRIVPARELSLVEIEAFAKECHKQPDSCQVEVFVHGALCMCYSGQCQMSRVLGGVNGRSANRGLCAQPCRLPYTDESGETGYFLSPKDICALELIPELAAAGVDSFKIEGRLKSPEYVAIVTAVYRKYLDMYRDTGYVKVESSDMERLKQIFNRGGFGVGYLKGNPGQGLLSGDSPKNSGIYMGKVKAVKEGSRLVDVEVKGDLKIGDGVEIRGSNVTGNVLSYCRRNPNGTLRIGDIKGRVYPGDKLYKVTDKALSREAEASYANDYRRKIPVDVEFTAKEGKAPRLSLSEGSNTGQAFGKEPAEPAVNAPTGRDAAQRQLCKLGNTVFRADKVKIDMDENLKLPLSTINSLRREAVEQLCTQKLNMGREALSEEKLLEIGRIEMTDGDELCRRFSYEGMKPLPVEIFMEAAELEDGAVPYILNISKGRLDEYIEAHFEEIVEAARNTGILIGNLGWIRRFRERGVKVYGDYGLNVTNLQSKKALAEIGVETVVCSHELQESVKAGFPLMITEHPLASNYIVDRKGVKYSIASSPLGDKFLISLV